MRSWGSGAATGKFDSKRKRPQLRVFSARSMEEMFYAAVLRRNQFLRGRAWVTSSPLTSIVNSSGRITTLRVLSAPGHRKRPFSSRFAHTHNPLPSHTSAFRRVLLRLVNRNRCPLKGSCPRWSRTNPYRPSNPLAHINRFHGDVDFLRQPQPEHHALSAMRIRRISSASPNFQLLSIRRPLAKLRVKLAESSPAATCTSTSRARRDWARRQ
jgi:hypothetical protein